MKPFVPRGSAHGAVLMAMCLSSAALAQTPMVATAPQVNKLPGQAARPAPVADAVPTKPKTSPAPQANNNPTAPTESTAPAGSPHGTVTSPHGGSNAAGMRRPQAPMDRSSVDPTVPAGSVFVQLRDVTGAPLAARTVVLNVTRQTIAEGTSRSIQQLRTDQSGFARFQRLSSNTDFSYRIRTEQGEATYASPIFRLSPAAGQSLLLHVLPVTRQLSTAMVGMTGFVSVQPRDDVFSMEVSYTVFNVGANTWVPSSVSIQLPEGATAVTAEEGMADTRFVPVGEDRVKLVGTYGPGKHAVSYRYNLPNEHKETQSFDFELLPRVFEVRIASEAGPHMKLAVDDFPPAQEVRSETGQRVLLARRQQNAEQSPLETVRIFLSGMPTPGPGRWVAVALAALLALLGLISRWRSAPASRIRVPKSDVTAARNLLLEELVFLEKANDRKKIGPRTYRSARKELLDALARLEAIRAVSAG